MRWSLVFLIAAFVALSLYIGWEQGAFAFKKQQMALAEAPKAVEINEPLKSELLALITEKKLDAAAARYAEAKSESVTLETYKKIVALAEGEKKN